MDDFSNAPWKDSPKILFWFIFAVTASALAADDFFAIFVVLPGVLFVLLCALFPVIIGISNPSIAKRLRIFVGLVVLALIFVPQLHKKLDANVPFRRADWVSADTNAKAPIFFQDFTPRNRLMRRLEKQYKLIGMKRSQVEQILGPPDLGYYGKDAMAYRIDSTGFFDHPHIMFEFKNGKLVSYRDYLR